MKIAVKSLVTASMISIATENIRRRIYEGMDDLLPSLKIERLHEPRHLEKVREKIDDWLRAIVRDLDQVALKHGDIAPFTTQRFEEEFQGEFQLPPSDLQKTQVLKKLLALQISALAAMIELDVEEDLERATQ